MLLLLPLLACSPAPSKELLPPEQGMRSAEDSGQSPDTGTEAQPRPSETRLAGGGITLLWSRLQQGLGCAGAPEDAPEVGVLIDSEPARDSETISGETGRESQPPAQDTEPADPSDSEGPLPPDSEAPAPVDSEAVLDCGEGAVVLEVQDLQFVAICAGTTPIGCTTAQAKNGECFDHEVPAHQVTITRDFYLTRAEVNQQSFTDLMGFMPGAFLGTPLLTPVDSVSWDQAAAFTNSLSKEEGLTECYNCAGVGSLVECQAFSDVQDCEGYRLPTEAEWEVAARCGEDHLYAGSDVLEDVAWYDGTSGMELNSSALLAPNACGLYDMSGNLWEWTHDARRIYAAADVTDPVGDVSTSDATARGGSWNDNSAYVRVSCRGVYSRSDSYSSMGFRVARTVH